MITPKKKVAVYVIGFLLFLWLFGVVYYSSFKPLPNGTSYDGPVHLVPSESVEFLSDLTYKDSNGEFVYEHEIFDNVFHMIDNANEFILIDMFLMGFSDEGIRNLSGEFSDKLIGAKDNNPDLIINFISDPINNNYYAFDHPEIKRIDESGVNVVMTNLDALRDSNPIYASLWRYYIQDFGVSDSLCFGIDIEERSFCIRSTLKYLNAKANHRKVVVADYINDDGEMGYKSLITSANPDNYGSGYSNVGLLMDEKIWRDFYFTEKSIADFSGGFDEYEFKEIKENDGEIELKLLTEGKIKKHIIEEIDNSVSGEKIEMAMFLFTDRDVIKALSDASERGVEINLVLDPSNNLFGQDSAGVPNVYAAKDVVERTNGKINVRWYDTGALQFHPKLIVITKSDGKMIVFIGSANMTRRNLGDYNGESDVKMKADSDLKVMVDIREFLDRIWNNEDGVYTVEYSEFEGNSKFMYWKYRFQEATGLGAF
jgi:cardiolipin synthase